MEYVLAHHGVKGQKWGIRRYQNPDGSLTAEGRKRLGIDNIKSFEDYEKRNSLNFRLNKKVYKTKGSDYLKRMYADAEYTRLRNKQDIQAAKMRRELKKEVKGLSNKEQDKAYNELNKTLNDGKKELQKTIEKAYSLKLGDAEANLQSRRQAAAALALMANMQVYNMQHPKVKTVYINT